MVGVAGLDTGARPRSIAPLPSEDPAKRLGNLVEARQDIEAALASPFKLPRALADSLRWHLSRPAVRATGVALVMLLGGSVLYQARRGETPVPQLTNPIQVTSTVGVEDHPTWSPDGRTLAYESNETGNWDIWLTQVGGQAVNRTADHSGHDLYASWSPDGRWIAFWSSSERRRLLRDAGVGRSTGAAH